MSEKEKLNNSDARLDEEKLANGLVSRGLMTNEEIKKHAPDGSLGAEGYLKTNNSGVTYEGTSRASPVRPNASCRPANPWVCDA